MQQDLFIKMVLDAWNSYLKRTTDLFNELSDEQLLKEISPGRNRGIYLLGHLTAVHDRMLPVLGFGEVLFPELWDPFVEQPDKKVKDLPPITQLKQHWKKVNDTLSDKFSKMTANEWFQRHNSVSAEDFAKEPHRNKLNIIINRTGHLSAHYGQLVLLRQRD
jgi:hypothetical protein